MINSDLSPPSADDDDEEDAEAENLVEEEDDGFDWGILLLPVGGILLVLLLGYLVMKGTVCYCRNCWC